MPLTPCASYRWGVMGLIGLLAGCCAWPSATFPVAPEGPSQVVVWRGIPRSDDLPACPTWGSGRSATWAAIPQRLPPSLLVGDQGRMPYPLPQNYPVPLASLYRPPMPPTREGWINPEFNRYSPSRPYAPHHAQPMRDAILRNSFDGEW